jgi:creatine kinase
MGGGVVSTPVGPVSWDDVKDTPVARILKLDEAKFGELKGEDGTVSMEKWATVDPYLKYGGAYKGDSKDSTDFHYVTFEDLPNFGPEHKSLMSKVLTKELFDALKDKKSSKGYTLSNAIQTGVVTPHLMCGATAGDEECWEIFKDLYYPIVKEWHGYDAYTQKHPVDLDSSKLTFTEEQNTTFTKYVVSTRIRAARNLGGFSLPTGATDEDRAAVETVLKTTFSGFEGELAGTYYPLDGMDDATMQSLLDAGFLFQIPTDRNLLTGAGAARSWPKSRGIFHNESKTALAWVNEEDHCRIISMELGGNIPSVFKRFGDISNEIKTVAEANGSSLMWNDTLGFMGTCPTNLGTGLRASVMVVLTEFNKLMEGDNVEDKELLEQVCSSFDLQPRGSKGEHSPADGGKFDVSNKQRLGQSEVQLVQKMIDGVTKVIAYEEMLAAGKTPADIRTAMAAEAPAAVEAAPAAVEAAAPAAEAAPAAAEAAPAAVEA